MPSLPLQVAEHALLDERRSLTRDEVGAVGALPLDELPDLVALAHKVRLAYCGADVELESLINAKSGACPEDCAFCSQSVKFDTDVDVYAFLDVDEVVEAAQGDPRRGRDAVLHRRRGARAVRAPARQGDRGRRRGARRDRPRGRVLARSARPSRRRSGSRRRASSATTTTSRPRGGVPVDLHHPHLRGPGRHRELAIDAGMELCCGGILGMGETLDQRIDFAFELAELEPCEVPINFLLPSGTPLGEERMITPREALQAIALFRLVLPSAWLRLAGGREYVLGELQGMGLLAGANALIVGNYLTTGGRAAGRGPRAARGAGHAGGRRSRRGPVRDRRHRHAQPPAAPPAPRSR